MLSLSYPHTNVHIHTYIKVGGKMEISGGILTFGIFEAKQKVREVLIFPITTETT